MSSSSRQCIPASISKRSTRRTASTSASPRGQAVGGRFFELFTMPSTFILSASTGVDLPFPDSSGLLDPTHCLLLLGSCARRPRLAKSRQPWEEEARSHFHRPDRVPASVGASQPRSCRSPGHAAPLPVLPPASLHQKPVIGQTTFVGVAFV